MYGDPQVHPQPETYWGNVNPIGPRGVYDEAKRYAEALTMAYHRQQGVDTAIVRIFNTYGPRMRPHDGRAIPTFMRQALEGKPLTVFGDGSQTRSFCYVDDLIRGLILLAESGEHLPGQHRQPAGVHAARARREGARGQGRRQRDRLRGAAGGRSQGAPARHHTRAADPRLGARDHPRGRAAAAPRRRRNARLRKGVASLAIALVGGRGLWPCPRRPPRASSSVGLFDDTQFNYGNPDQVFPVLKQLRTQLIRVNLTGAGRTASPSDGRSTR